MLAIIMAIVMAIVMAVSAVGKCKDACGCKAEGN